MKKTKMSHKGRICKFPKCKHVLSIYNHQTFCHIHLSRVGAAYKEKVLE